MEKKYLITDEVLKSWPGPRLLQERIFYEKFFECTPITACRLSQIYLLGNGRKLAGETYLAADANNLKFIVSANNRILTADVEPSFTDPCLLLINQNGAPKTHNNIRPSPVTSNLLAAYTLFPFEHIPYAKDKTFNRINRDDIDEFRFVMIDGNRLGSATTFHYITKAGLWFRAALTAVEDFFDFLIEQPDTFVTSNALINTAITFFRPTGINFPLGRDRSLRSLDTVLQLFDIFFAQGFAIALAEFGDEAAREILFKFANPEYQAQLKAALTIQAALHV